MSEHACALRALVIVPWVQWRFTVMDALCALSMVSGGADTDFVLSSDTASSAAPSMSVVVRSARLGGTRAGRAQ